MVRDPVPPAGSQANFRIAPLAGHDLVERQSAEELAADYDLAGVAV